MAFAELNFEEVQPPPAGVTLVLTMREAQLVRDLVGATPCYNGRLDEDAQKIYNELVKLKPFKEPHDKFIISLPSGARP